MHANFHLRLKILIKNAFRTMVVTTESERERDRSCGMDEYWFQISLKVCIHSTGRRRCRSRRRLHIRTRIDGKMKV